MNFPEASLILACVFFVFWINCAEVPALRISFPGPFLVKLILCIKVPMGISFKGKALPIRKSACFPVSIFWF